MNHFHSLFGAMTLLLAAFAPSTAYSQFAVPSGGVSSSMGLSAPEMAPRAGSSAVGAAEPANRRMELIRPVDGGSGAAGGAGSADELNRVLSRSRGLVKDEAPSQFQRFVQEATGTLLPNFGSQLFDAPQNYVPDAGLAVPSNYILGPGDEVRINMWGAVDVSASFVIDRDGRIMLPKVGALSLTGVAASHLEQVLKSHLGKVFTNFGLSATLGKLRSVQVYVVGQARQPGTYAVSSLSTLVNVLFVSGGPNSNGSMRSIELQRGGKVVTRLDLYDFIAKGDKSKDVVVQPGDVVFIPPALRRVAVTGTYDQAAIYELTEAGTTIAEILALGGGASPISSTRKALLERVYPDRVPARQVMTLALDDKGLQQPLAGGDILTLLPLGPAFSNAVTLQGVVAEPLRFSWFEGMRISDLIPDREALITPSYFRKKNSLILPGAIRGRSVDDVEKGKDDERVESRMRAAQDEINWDYAVVERVGKGALIHELIPFNLGKAVLLRDAASNITLQPGDVVTVMSQKDLAVPQEKQSRLVRVEGEVAVPGVYQALPGETLPQLLKRIGGFTAQAYVFGLEFGRESVRKRQQENLATLIRRLEAQLQGQVQTTTGASSQDAVASAVLLQQQQQAQLQSQITRLKALRSDGRLTLELDPGVQALNALPALPLEDGDRVYVPSVPGFVAALGAVNNENAIIYKPGRTVGDIVRSAGVTDDAEVDAVFLLRADGSVVSKKSSGGLFGGGFESHAVMPGDILVVPAKIDKESGYAFTVRALKDWTQIFSNLGIGAAAIKTLRN